MNKEYLTGTEPMMHFESMSEIWEFLTEEQKTFFLSLYTKGDS